MKNLKYILPIFAFLLGFTVFAQNDTKKDEVKSDTQINDAVKHSDDKVVSKKVTDGVLYGTDITADAKVLSVTEILADTAAFTGKTVVVKGNMTELCRSGGCWTVISDGTNNIRALTQHKFVMPIDMDITGKTAVVEGTFAVKEITEEQAKHFAEESGKDPNTITGSQKMYRIVATGIKILN